jgi:predicted transcriptional regulator
MNTPVTAVRIPQDLRAKLEKLAEKENRSLSNLIVTLLEKAVRTK